MTKVERIFIVGHSGAGKGVLAKALAEKLGWKFLDADFSLAPTTGRSLEEILGKQGEEKFHQCLLDIMTQQAQQKNIVVTTDDSLVCSEKGRKLLRAEFAVYLKVSVPTQVERISYNRPLLPVGDYSAFLEAFHKERDAFYEQSARLSVGEEESLEQHVTRIVQALN